MIHFPEPILARDKEGRIHVLATTANACAFIISVLPLPHARWLELVIAIKALGAAEADKSVIKHAATTLRDWLTAEGLLHDRDFVTNSTKDQGGDDPTDLETSDGDDKDPLPSL